VQAEKDIARASKIAGQSSSIAWLEASVMSIYILPTPLPAYLPARLPARLLACLPGNVLSHTFANSLCLLGAGAARHCWCFQNSGH
jgi:hypothetical protein